MSRSDYHLRLSHLNVLFVPLALATTWMHHQLSSSPLQQFWYMGNLPCWQFQCGHSRKIQEALAKSGKAKSISVKQWSYTVQTMTNMVTNTWNQNMYCYDLDLIFTVIQLKNCQLTEQITSKIKHLTRTRVSRTPIRLLTITFQCTTPTVHPTHLKEQFF